MRRNFFRRLAPACIFLKTFEYLHTLVKFAYKYVPMHISNLKLWKWKWKWNVEAEIENAGCDRKQQYVNSEVEVKQEVIPKSRK